MPIKKTRAKRKQQKSRKKSETIPKKSGDNQEKN